METPLYLRRILLPEGAETITGSNARPRRCALPGAPFIGVVFNGRGRVLDWFAGETQVAAIEPALEAYVEREKSWTKLGAANKPRPVLPPVWGAYQLTDGRYVRLPPGLAVDSETHALPGPLPVTSGTEPAIG